MDFTRWQPVLFALGIVAMAGFMAVLAAVDRHGPSLLRRSRSRQRIRGGSRSRSHGCARPHGAGR